MPLQKTTLEFPIKGGLLEKVPKEILPDGFATRAENVDLRKDGSVRRRRGFSEMSSAAIVDNTASTLDTNIRRLATRNQQALVAIADTAHALGSGGGSSGEVGSTIYEFAGESEVWIANGTIPIPTVEQVWGHAKISDGFRVPTAIAAGGGFLLLAASCTFAFNGGCMIEVIDLSTGGCVIRDGDTFGLVPVLEAVFVDTFLLVFAANNGGGSTLWWRCDTANIAAGFQSGSVATFDFRAVSTDGTHVYAAYNNASNFLVLHKYDSDMVSVSSTTVYSGSADANRKVSIDARQGNRVDMFWTEPTDGTVMFSRRISSSLSAAWGPFIVNGPAVDEWNSPYVTTLVVGGLAADGLALACWVRQAGSQRWSLIDSSGIVGVIHDVAGEFIRCQPWYMNGHCYALAIDSNQETSALLPVVPSYPRYAATNYCVEIDVDEALNSNNFKTVLPSAAWLTDIGSTLVTMKAYQYNSKSYVVVARWVDGGDIDWDVTDQFTQSRHQLRPTVYALNFAEPKRYQNVEWNGLTVFAGGVPWVFDGLHAHEATHLQWPRLSVSGTGAGTLVVGTRYTFRSVFKYVDKSGRIYWSEPSSIGEFCSHTPTVPATNGGVTITVSTPLICAMPQGGFNFAGSVTCEVYVATDVAPDIYYFVSSFETNTFHIGPLPTLAVSAPVAATETRFLYTSGGELENVTAPPCLSIEQHRGRLWLGATDENKVWFSKPPQPQRGPEFCLEFTFDLPAPCTALVSNEDRIIIFTKKTIFYVEGDGPGPTGVPVNGFSKLAQLHVDEGCVEQNAAVRTPYGIIYRGRKGFMLLTRSLELKFIGEGVEDSFESYVDTILSLVHDPKLGCCAISVQKSGVYRTFRFWYDTAQWSIDELATNTTEIRDSIVLGEDYYHALNGVGVWKTENPALTSVHADAGDYVRWVWESGWMRFSDLHSFKRIWRTYITARALESEGSLAGECDLQVELSKDFEADPFQLETFRLPVGKTKQFRIHMKKQKLRAVKVRITQLRGNGSVESWGAEVLGLGFEAGMKRGGAKLGKEDSR